MSTCHTGWAPLLAQPRIIKQCGLAPRHRRSLNSKLRLSATRRLNISLHGLMDVPLEQQFYPAKPSINCNGLDSHLYEPFESTEISTLLGLRHHQGAQTVAEQDDRDVQSTNLGRRTRQVLSNARLPFCEFETSRSNGLRSASVAVRTSMPKQKQTPKQNRRSETKTK